MTKRDCFSWLFILDTFFKKAAFQCGSHTNESENNNCTNTLSNLTDLLQKIESLKKDSENEPQSKEESDKK